MLRRKLLAGIGTATTALALGVGGSASASESRAGDLKGPSSFEVSHAAIRDEDSVRRVIPLGMLRNGADSLDVGTMGCTAECCENCTCDRCLCGTQCGGGGGGGC